MRKLLAVAIAAGLVGSAGFAGEASATATVDLVWQASNTVVPGGSATLDVILSTDVALGAAPFLVGLADTSATAPKITAATNTPSPFLALTFTITPAAPNGTQVGRFGGVTLSLPVAPGTYTLGNVTLQAGTKLGGFAIDPFQVEDVDDFLDGSTINVIVPTLNGATLNVIPEPATAALFGLGLVGVAAVSRRSRMDA